MRYIPLMKDDFDASFKFKKQSFRCYSEDKFKEVSQDKDHSIIGLARKSDKDKEDELVLDVKKNKSMPIFDTEKSSLMYKSIGYLPVNDGDQYIAVQESRFPFLIIFFGILAMTAAICIMLAKPSAEVIPPESTASKFNPLPPIDTNIEDLNDTPSPKNEDNTEDPKGGGKVEISYKPKADVDLSTGEIKMEYSNPDSSSHDAVISLYVVSGDEEYLIASSGRIPAGNQLKTMQLTADKNIFSSEGRYNAEYRIFYYDPVTGERALAEATIDDITLTVRND